MKNLFLAVLIALSTSLTAMAGVPSTQFVQINTGTFDNAGLAGFSTWAMRVTADTDWTNADLDIELTSGTMNHIAPAFLGNPEGTGGFGDTAGLAPTVVNGDLTGGFNGTYSNAQHSESTTEFLSKWFTTNTDDIGTFDVAMITISDDANGALRFRTLSGADADASTWDPKDPVTGNRAGGIPFIAITNGIIGVPEPTSLVMASLGLVGLYGTRCRRRRA